MGGIDESGDRGALGLWRAVESLWAPEPPRRKEPEKTKPASQVVYAKSDDDLPWLAASKRPFGLDPAFPSVHLVYFGLYDAVRLDGELASLAGAADDDQVEPSSGLRVGLCLALDAAGRPLLPLEPSPVLWTLGRLRSNGLSDPLDPVERDGAKARLQAAAAAVLAKTDRVRISVLEEIEGLARSVLGWLPESGRGCAVASKEQPSAKPVRLKELSEILVGLSSPWLERIEGDASPPLQALLSPPSPQEGFDCAADASYALPLLDPSRQCPAGWPSPLHRQPDSGVLLALSAASARLSAAPGVLAAATPAGAGEEDLLRGLAALEAVATAQRLMAIDDPLSSFGQGGEIPLDGASCGWFRLDTVLHPVGLVVLGRDAQAAEAARAALDDKPAYDSFWTSTAALNQAGHLRRAAFGSVSLHALRLDAGRGSAAAAERLWPSAEDPNRPSLGGVLRAWAQEPASVSWDLARRDFAKAFETASALLHERSIAHAAALEAPLAAAALARADLELDRARARLDEILALDATAAELNAHLDERTRTCGVLRSALDRARAVSKVKEAEEELAEAEAALTSLEEESSRERATVSILEERREAAFRRIEVVRDSRPFSLGPIGGEKIEEWRRQCVEAEGRHAAVSTELDRARRMISDLDSAAARVDAERKSIAASMVGLRAKAASASFQGALPAGAPSPNFDFEGAKAWLEAEESSIARERAAAAQETEAGRTDRGRAERMLSRRRSLEERRRRDEAYGWIWAKRLGRNAPRPGAPQPFPPAASPWMDPEAAAEGSPPGELHAARAACLFAALRLREAFAASAAPKLSANLRLLAAHLRGEAELPKEALPHLWRSLLLCVPALALPWRDLPRLFPQERDLFSWCLVLGAHAAPPQAAPSLFSRAARAVVCGDSFLPGPARPLPAGVLAALRTSRGADEAWDPSMTTLLALAEAREPYAAWLEPKESSPARQAGMLVRRDLRTPPVLSKMAARLSYGARVSYEAAPAPNPPNLPSSGWIDLAWAEGVGTEGNFSSSEADAAMAIVERLEVDPDSDVLVAVLFKDALLPLRRTFSKKRKPAWLGVKTGELRAMEGRRPKDLILVLGGRPGARPALCRDPSLLLLALSLPKRSLFVVGDRSGWGSLPNAAALAADPEFPTLDPSLWRGA